MSSSDWLKNWEVVAPAAIRKQRDFVSLASFGIRPGSASDLSARIQSAITSVYENGDRALSIPAGQYNVDVGANIIIPANMHIFGTPGSTKIQGIGTNWPNNPTFPNVGGGLFNIGNPSTGQRYGTQTGRMTSGTGATFNLTMGGIAPNLYVASATIAAGGTGYNVGDAINITGGAQLIVSSISGSAFGAVTGVTVGSAGVYSSTPSNPVSQTTSFGNRIQDRILDANTFSQKSKFTGIVFDGGYTSGTLSTSKTLFGIKAVGVIDLDVSNCEFLNFPHSGLFCNDVQRRTVRWNKFINCGYGGTAGTGTAAADRNGATVGGIYLRSSAALSKSHLEYAFNYHQNIKGSGVEFHYTDAHVHGNVFNEIYEIGIEGQASGFNVVDTFANNGGIVIPGDADVHDNFLNGKMSDGSIGMIVGAISLSDGNENTKIVSRNRISNTDTYAVACSINNNGHVTIDDNDCDNVNMATVVSALQAIYTSCEDVRIRRNRIYGAGRAPFVYASALGTQQIDISNNVLRSAGGSSNSAIFIQIARSRTIDFVRISGNEISTTPMEAIIFEVVGSSTVTVRLIEIDKNQIINHNLQSQAIPAISIRTGAGSKLDYKIATIRDNQFYESTLRTPNGTAPIKMAQVNNSAALKTIIDGNIGSGYTVDYSVSTVSPNVPTVTGTNYLS